MGSLRAFRDFNRDFWLYFWKYGQVVILVQLISNLILAPALGWLTNTVLDLGNVNYLSYTNLPELILHKPLVILALLVILVLILLLVFGQFALLLVSFQAIKSRANLRWRDYFKTVLHKTYALPFKAFGFFLLYFLLIIPFGTLGLSSNLLDKVKIPEFILEWLVTDHLPLAILVFALYALAFYYGLRWLFVIPLMIFEHKSIRAAMKRSWAITRRKLLYYLGIFLAAAIVAAIFSQLSFGVILGLQWLFDHVTFLKLPMAILNLSLVQLFNYIISIYMTAISALIILSQTRATYQYSRQVHRTHKWFWITLATVTIAGFISYSVAYFQNWLIEKPATISHRGVDNGNGVQNSITALKKTAKLKPTYIEMDVQETKDHQFVVLHDNTLNKLAGINKKPSQMTLKQLTGTKIHENGQTASIASFDDYLKTANALDQKLLVEFKDVRGNRANFVKRFAQKYNRQLIQNKAMIHSLSYNYIEQSKKYMPHIPASYILSFNLSGVPKSNADAFTMEYTTLNGTFVDAVHLQHKKVYAWTVNDTTEMSQMIFLDVDGIITDDLTGLKQEIQTNFHKNTYAGRILNYYTQMQAPF
ncbi:glycerophosphoryl diester phosphodiesterase membrane domain-containing protein [Agrilactobacillus yilanensis]|uniref:Glycerophosphoryl diester phosphodiesterase membrane domain-containing protein n=1 Tax=Agrilactobacillus yilanensis TaxID=2485997 RepID=A0ABW4J2X3_9LACO|nr:glycerophosphodiester phosphodiesterase [Agrilactobacillus yilanensis]